jgi:hypothetical protein
MSNAGRAMAKVRQKCHHIKVGYAHVGSLEYSDYRYFGKSFVNLKECELGRKIDTANSLQCQACFRTCFDETRGITHHLQATVELWDDEDARNHRSFQRRNSHLEVFIVTLKEKSEFGLRKGR